MAGVKIDTSVNIVTLGSLLVVLVGSWFGLQFLGERFDRHVASDGHPTMVKDNTKNQTQIEALIKLQDRLQMVVDRQQTQILEIANRASR